MNLKYIILISLCLIFMSVSYADTIGVSIIPGRGDFEIEKDGSYIDFRIYNTGTSAGLFYIEVESFEGVVQIEKSPLRIEAGEFEDISIYFEQSFYSSDNEKLRLSFFTRKEGGITVSPKVVATYYINFIGERTKEWDTSVTSTVVYMEGGTYEELTDICGIDDCDYIEDTFSENEFRVLNPNLKYYYAIVIILILAILFVYFKKQKPKLNYFRKFKKEVTPIGGFSLE